MKYRGAGPEWFGPVVGTLSVSLTLYLISLVYNNSIIFRIGSYVYYLDLFIFFFVLVSLFYYYISGNGNIIDDSFNIQKFPFFGFIGILYFALAFFFYAYIGINRDIAFIMLYLYYFFYAYMIILNLLLSYRIYTGAIKYENIAYTSLIPIISLAGNIILSSILMPPTLDYFINYRDILISMYMLIMAGTGIAVLQFIFIGNISIMAHMNNGRQKAPATMIPLGASSMIAINLLFMPIFNKLKIFYVPEYLAVDVSTMLWGFEVLSFLTGLVMAIFHFRNKPSVATWAYVFPSGISTFANYLLYIETGLQLFKYSILIISIGVYGLYIYSLKNTFIIIKNALKNS
ncbi:transporter [Picrophilus oshimae]|uniref:Hypothetical transporter n=1 Tax=Picrophilus torridus (strain ATCC 700027 / DSM 9790 / JCM 10055 / NBRC 100828 / KAW 2/3) TaxID=1122961 RepID=Q6L0I0_PICTO|nr:transporter [Picrophilus oshimae]AAT43522.1 hypothetical transporter [Picrophilus oshimae DSM 9789]